MIKKKKQQQLYTKRLLHKPLASLQTLEVSGVKLSYFLTGGDSESPVLVCFGGLYEQKEHFADFAQAIGKDYRVLALDWLGHGESENKLEYWQIEGQVSLVEQVIATLKTQYKIAALLGQSFGATLLLMHANLHLEDRLIIGNLTHLRSEKTELLYTQMIENGHQSPYVIETQADFEALMYLYFSQPEQFKQYDFKQWSQQAMEMSTWLQPCLESWYREFGLFFTESFLKHSLATTTLIIWGSEDPLYDVRKGHIVKWTIPHSQISLIAGAGHLPFSEQPVASAKAVLAFLNRPEVMPDEY